MTHARQRLPASLEIIVQPLERAGEKIEKATKEEVEPEEEKEEH